MGISLPAFALEVSQITPPQMQPPSCSSMQYLGNSPPPPQGQGIFPKATCDQCKQAVESAGQQANSALQGAKGADQSVNASSSAGTQATNAATQQLQQDHQSKNGTVNDIGKNGLSQQSSIAKQVSAAMKQCAQQIQSACSGVQVQEDKSAADQSAQSCQQSGQQADQVAGEKAAKAGEMAKNEGTSNDNAEKLGKMPEMPQMPQGGQGGGKGGSGSGSGLSGTNYDSGLASGSSTSTSTDTAKNITPEAAKLEYGKGSELGGGTSRNVASIDAVENKIDSGVSNAGNSSDGGNSPAAAGSSGGDSARSGQSVAHGTGGNSGGATGVTTGGSAGSLSTSGASMSPGSSEKDGSSTAASGGGSGGNSGEALVPFMGGGAGGGSGYTPLKSAVLGLSTEGGEIKELVGSSSLLAANGAHGGAGGALLHDKQGGLTKQINEVSLFKRVSGTIRRISLDRTMQ